MTAIAPATDCGWAPTSSSGWVQSTGPRLTETLDALDLTEDKGLSVVSDAGRLAAVPVTRDPDGQWRRALPGDGVADALLACWQRRRGRDAGPIHRAFVDPRTAAG